MTTSIRYHLFMFTNSTSAGFYNKCAGVARTGDNTLKANHTVVMSDSYDFIRV